MCSSVGSHVGSSAVLTVASGSRDDPASESAAASSPVLLLPPPQLPPLLSVGANAAAVLVVVEVAPTAPTDGGEAADARAGVRGSPCSDCCSNADVACSLARASTVFRLFPPVSPEIAAPTRAPPAAPPPVDSAVTAGNTGVSQNGGTKVGKGNGAPMRLVTDGRG